MDDPPLVRAHRVHLDGLLVPDRILGGQVGPAAQGLALAPAIAGRVDRDPLALLAAAEGGLVAEQLDRVDRLAVAADQQADVLAVDVGADLVLALLDRDRGVQAELLDDPLEQRPNPLGRLLGQHRGLRIPALLRPRGESRRAWPAGTYRRRLRLRGGGGGGFAARTSSGVGTAGRGQTKWITVCCPICQRPLAMK